MSAPLRTGPSSASMARTEALSLGHWSASVSSVSVAGFGYYGYGTYAGSVGAPRVVSDGDVGSTG